MQNCLQDSPLKASTEVKDHAADKVGDHSDSAQLDIDMLVNLDYIATGGSYPPLIDNPQLPGALEDKDPSTTTDVVSYATVLARGPSKTNRTATRIISKITVELNGQEYYLLEDELKNSFFLDKAVAEQKYASLVKQYQAKVANIPSRF